MTAASDQPTLSAVLLSGAPGVGKSIVAKEIHELLRLAGVANAMIDLDAIGRVWPATDEPFNSKFVVSNLRAMWPNYETLGLKHIVLARVLLHGHELAEYRASFPSMSLRVVRLEADTDEIQRRLQIREPGVSQSWLMDIAPRMAAEMRSNNLDDFVIDSGGSRSVTEVALDVLDALGWPKPE